MRIQKLQAKNKIHVVSFFPLPSFLKNCMSPIHRGRAFSAALVEAAFLLGRTVENHGDDAGCSSGNY